MGPLEANDLTFLWTGKFLYESKTNYKESKLASNLIADTT